jgi:hypothetical protein
MSVRTHTSRRPRPAVMAGLCIVVALMVSACGGGSGGGSSSPATSRPAAVSAPATQVTTTTSTSMQTTTSDSGLSGKWKGTYTGAYSGTFVLNWTQSSSKLHGTIDLSTAGTVPVNGTVDGSSIKFGTVGGSAVHYTGSVSGDSMSGSYTTAGGDGSWTARKA